MTTTFDGRRVANCPRCGRRRTLGKKPSPLCADCRYVEPNWPDVDIHVEKESA